MGTNYYFITKNKRLAHEHFEGEYELIDEPELGYEIHLNKCSCGWLPLFQIHKAFSTFAGLEKFYWDHKDDLEIYDEYDDKFTFEEYKQMIIEHSEVKPRPCKFEVVDHGLYGGICLDPKDCEPDEADIWCPFRHGNYAIAERKAQQRLEAWNANVGWVEDYIEDPDYLFDWIDCEFC